MPTIRLLFDKINFAVRMFDSDRKSVMCLVAFRLSHLETDPYFVSNFSSFTLVFRTMLIFVGEITCVSPWLASSSIFFPNNYG